MEKLQYVNIKQGSDSVNTFSNGNTLPLVQMPFGMNAFTLNTNVSGGRWFYNPRHRICQGIRLTHQPSPWVSDFASLIIMPQAGVIGNTSGERSTGYRPEETILSPNYMKVKFLRSRSEMELTPTERCAKFAFKFNYNNWDAYLSVLRIENDIQIEINEAENKVYGTVNHFSNNYIGKDKNNFKMYFVIKFDCKISAEKSIKANDEGYHIALCEHEGTATIGTSFISFNQAEISMENEIGNKSFAEICEQGKNIWENMLNKIEIKADENIMRTFYSCLYRTMLFPNKLYEINGEGKVVHQNHYTDEADEGYFYTNNGFWDTHRTVYPLLSIIDPEINKEMLKGFIQFYKDTGWLPKWPSYTEFNCMPGTLIDAVIADAAVKGLIEDDDLRIAFEGMLKHAQTESEDGLHGRKGIDFYNEHGYVPRSVKESVNCTQDYAYGDYCIAQVAHILGETEIEAEFLKRAKNYKNIFDKETGFMRSKDEQGNMEPIEQFDCFAWGGDYTEGSAWQNSFAVYHDYQGLAELYGGKAEFLKKIDEIFNTPPYYSCGGRGYGGEIHEMTEMAAVDFGQFAISNQPSFHYPWIYAMFDQKDKAQYWITKTVKELFSYKDDGFPGDEDNGTMAAWYIFAVLGFYPSCPGTTKYIRTSPLAKKIKICGKKVPYKNKNKEFDYKDLI